MKSGVYLCIPVRIYPTHPCVLHSSMYTPLLRIYPIPLYVPYSSVFNSLPTPCVSHSVCIPVHGYPIPPCVPYSSICTLILHVYFTPHSICTLLCVCPSLCVPHFSVCMPLICVYFIPNFMCTSLRVYPALCVPVYK